MTSLEQIRSFFRLPWLEKIQSMEELYWSLKTQYYYKLFFACIGRKSKVIAPMRLRNVHNIHIGEGVIINRFSFLFTYAASEERPRLIIGDGCRVGHMSHIACTREVRIGKKVLIADRVYISDHSHGFSDINLPIMDQPHSSKGIVSIGEGTWIGENVTILSCSIGRNCVVGSNAVVISDLPDFSVAVGVPARVIRAFNPASGIWEKVEHQ
jgi:acetyltransferase-like isoleucine patch superfamily enzyme